MSLLSCPKCESKRVVGHEVSGVYDGVLYWQCMECAWAWNRWNQESMPNRWRLAENFIEKVNFNPKECR